MGVMNTEEISIKRSPIVVIRTLVAIELCAFLAYYLAATLGNSKYELFLRLPLLPSLISYQALKFFILSGVQFVITVYAFLRWYYESYTIKPGAISHQRGVFLKQRTMTPLHASMSFTVVSGPLKNLLHYGTIYIRENTSNHTLTLADISRPEQCLATIEKALDSRPTGGNNAPRKQPDVAHLLEEDEHEQLEFKSSLRFDHRTNQVNREIEKTAMKTIAAFLNSKGGSLVVGVDDGHRPLGIHYDYQTIGRQDRDGFENHFTQVFNKMIGAEFRHHAQLRFHTLEGKELCVVDVEPSSAPVYLRLDNDEHFYVRTGNVSTPLRLSEVESYARSRWPRGTVS